MQGEEVVRQVCRRSCTPEHLNAFTRFVSAAPAPSAARAVRCRCDGCRASCLPAHKADAARGTCGAFRQVISFSGGRFLMVRHPPCPP